MKEYTFLRSVSFGAGDSSDPIEFSIDVTDEEYDLLKMHEDEGDCFEEIEDLSDVYSRALLKASELSIDELEAENEASGDELFDVDCIDVYVSFCEE